MFNVSRAITYFLHNIALTHIQQRGRQVLIHHKMRRNPHTQRRIQRTHFHVSTRDNQPHRTSTQMFQGNADSARLKLRNRNLPALRKKVRKCVTDGSV